MNDTRSAAAGDYRFLLALVRPYRGALAIALVLLLAQSAVSLVNPWLAGKFSDAVIHHQPMFTLLAAWFALVVVQSLLAYFAGLRLQYVTLDLTADLSNRTFDHLQALPLAWHRDRQRGDVLSLLTQDVWRLGQFVTQTATPLLPLTITCVGALVLMFRILPWVGVGAAVLMPILYVTLRWVGRRLRPLGKQVVEAYGGQAAWAERSLSILPLAKAFTAEPAESAGFKVKTATLRDLQKTEARLQALVGPSVRVVAALAILLLLWFAGMQVVRGTLSAGDLVSLLLYGLLLTSPMSALASVYGQVQSARGAARRIIDLLRESPEPEDGTFVPATAVRGEVAFEHVAFSYAGRAQVLHGLDLALKPGETVAITGVNGAGKSTLAHLLLRFADPSAGRILLDGRDLRDYTLAALRGQIGLVPQDPLLFNASVRENIGYGRAGATQDLIEAAARAARAHDFIAALPQGYDTPIGDAGVKLSGGQRQRVALARALLKDPAVLILDEATAMFDPAAEREFIEQCHGLLWQRTVLLITHRPASLALADRVVKLDDGRLVAES